MVSDWTPQFDQRVRVRADLCAVPSRVFLWCEKRPTICATHGVKHSGDLWTEGHHLEEAGQHGEIVSYLGGEPAQGHHWIVRFDRNLTIAWPDGQILTVNAGAYTAAELEPVDEAQ